MKLNLNILFIIFIIVLSNFVEAQSYTPKSYSITENDQFYNNVAMFSNGNILIRFFNKLNTSYHEPDLHLKLFYENGTSSPLKIENFSPSIFNFITLITRSINDPFRYRDLIDLRFFDDNIYITYYNISESDPNAPFGQIFLQANLDGKVMR